MNMHTSDAAGHADRLQRPSIYGDMSDSAKATPSFSVLGGLEPRRSRFKLFSRTARSASLLSLAAVILVFGLNGGFGHIGTSAGSATAVNNEALEQAMPKQVAAVSPQNTVSAPVVATIVSESRPSEAQRNAEVVTAPIDVTENEKVVAAPVVAALVPTDIAPQPRSGEHFPREIGLKSVAKKDQALPKKGGPKAASAAPKPARATAGSDAKDKDVDLIAALLAHVSPAASASPEKKTPRIKASTGARATSVSATPKRERNLKANRDIVTRDAAESLESLVNRCRSLGFFEGELCRLRICSGMWGKDPACPSSMPSSSS